ncbi:mitotic-spindle organizing protein 2B-like isoform X1 [Symphalangus syndactylus]|uniref:mitotic-spindle organizing protein 2B-like isoform X1 n=1 Tax=Symphalangus syndactylus TaxID=9590 RepID=UPI0024411388|nr:mitotic-spindle organizing protein 2B-like isoform X1 [Symphalangus syndactylus]
MTPRRRPRPRAAAGAAAPARAAREARRWRCRERAVGAAARGRGGAGRTFPCVARMAAQGVGPGPGSAAPPGLEAARQKLALRRKKVLSTEEMELYELAQAAGGAIDPDVFKILVDLLKLNVAPLAVFQMLKSMCAGQRLASEPQDPAAVSLPTSSVPETREASFLSARNSSPPARPSFSSSPQPAASPVLLHSPAATHSPLSPGPPGSLRLSCCLFSPFAGRNKGSTALGGALALVERSSREGSSQRMPRQPSATRLPKGGGPGKSPTRGST